MVSFDQLWRLEQNYLASQSALQRLSRRRLVALRQRLPEYEVLSRQVYYRRSVINRLHDECVRIGRILIGRSYRAPILQAG